MSLLDGYVRASDRLIEFKSYFLSLPADSHSLHTLEIQKDEIEAWLNSRPLSPMSENPSDLCALTPGHFLIGNPLLLPPEPDLTGYTISHINRWQKLRILHLHFAQRYKEEYLKELHKRLKWKYLQRDYCIGDLEVIRQDNLPSNHWRLGRVENVIRGNDNRVRVAEVRTDNVIITRPIVKLILLPLPEQHKLLLFYFFQPLSCLVNLAEVYRL